MDLQSLLEGARVPAEGTCRRAGAFRLNPAAGCGGKGPSSKGWALTCKRASIG